MEFVAALTNAGRFALLMVWNTWWALVLGFTIAGAIQTFISEDEMTALLGGRGLKAVSLGAVFGFLSSSCSFGAVASTKSLFKKGASPEASFAAFQFASTNLVIELGLVMWILLGWQFVAANVFGGILMMLLLAAVTKYVVPDAWFATAREHVRGQGEAVRDPVCGMEVDPDDDTVLSLETAAGPTYFCSQSCKQSFQETTDTDTSWRTTLFTRDGWRHASRNAISEWGMLWEDLVIGFVVAALIKAVVPAVWWAQLFSLAPEGTVAWVLAGAVIGVIVGVVTFVCSVANVPFALVLWNAGIPFGGVMAFIYADLIVPHITDIYRKYYGLRMAATLFVSIFAVAVLSGVFTHYAAAAVNIIPDGTQTGGSVPHWYTSVLNLIFTGVFLGQLYLTFGTTLAEDPHAHGQ